MGRSERDVVLQQRGEGEGEVDVMVVLFGYWFPRNYTASFRMDIFHIIASWA